MPTAAPGPAAPATTDIALPPAGTLAQVCDAFAWPLLLLRADTTLAHANEAARQLQRHGQPLTLTAQRCLRPGDVRHGPAFDRALQAARDGLPPALLRWPATQHAGAYCALLRALPQTDGEPPALLLTLCPDTGADDDLLALLTLRPPLVPPTPAAGGGGEGE
jgi:hypothetical protein